MEKSDGKRADIALLDKLIKKMTIEVEGLKIFTAEAVEMGATTKAQSELLVSMMHILEALMLLRDELNDTARSGSNKSSAEPYMDEYK